MTPFFKWFLLGMVALIVANTSDFIVVAFIWNLIGIGFFVASIVQVRRK